MSEELQHIFDRSACISKRQMREYISGMMNREEIRAVEHHLSYCEFCSEAIEGLTNEQNASHHALDELNDQFIRDYYARQEANQAKALAVNTSSKNKKAIWLSITGIAAALLICFVGIRYFNQLKSTNNLIIADTKLEQTPIQENQPASTQKQDELVYNSTPVQDSLAHGDKEIKSVMDTSVSTIAMQAPISNSKKSIALADASLNQKTERAKKAPAIEPKNARLIAKEQQTQNNADAVPLSGASVSPQTSGNAEEADITTEENVTPNKEADKLFENGKYNAALSLYKKQMNNGEAKERQQASLMAAKCYLGLNDKATAKNILQQLADTGSGRVRRQARRLLRDIE